MANSVNIVTSDFMKIQAPLAMPVKTIILTLMGSLFILSSTLAAKGEEIALVEAGKPKAVIILGGVATSTERHAAKELARYIKEMSGAVLRIVTSDEWQVARGKETAILIGCVETNPLIADLVREGKLKLSAEYPGLDGFIIRTLHQPPALVLGGSCPRGTLYAVYQLLENYCQVGFFWDGEHIPKTKTIKFRAINIAERPHFPIRQYLQGCAFAYTTPYWGWEEWKYEIEWAAKHKQNVMMMPYERAIPWRQTMREFGVDLGAPSQTELYRTELSKRMVNYARSLGIKVILGGYMGELPAQFKEVHPDCRYIEVKWGESPATVHIHPADPMFAKVGETFIKKTAQLYGTDHIYNIDPYPETRPGASPEEQVQIKLDFAQAVINYIKAADPQGIWYASGWAFIDTQYWPPEAVEQFLNFIPDDSFYVNDIWAEANPFYKRLNYFHAKDWGFSVLHSFGGDDCLHGDLAELIRRAQEVAADPKAKNCKAFYINPEIIHYNILYFELAAKLSWNPKAMELNQFLKDYAIKRYGLKSATNMLKCLKGLVASVYGTFGWGSEARYQHRLGEPGIDDPVELKYWSQCAAHLRQALEFALREADRQKDNKLYQHDLVDILRQYITELFNRHIVQAYAAYQGYDEQSFEKEVKVIDQLMDGLEKVLSSRPDYCIQPIIQKAKAIPGAGPDAGRIARDAMFTFAGWEPPWLIDYQSKDMFELVKFYYRKRLNAYLQALRNQWHLKELLPSTPNLLLNPGFEVGEAEKPAHWDLRFVYQGGESTRDAKNPQTGNWCGKASAPAGGYANLYQTIPAGPNQWYCLAAYMRTQGVKSAELHIDVFDDKDKIIMDKVASRILSGDSPWSFCGGFFKTPENTAKIKIYCRMVGPGMAWFDEVQLQLLAEEQVPLTLGPALDAAYRKIEKEWVDKPIEVSPEEKYPGTMLEAVKETFVELKKLELAAMPPIGGVTIKPGQEIGWQEDFADIGDWHQTYEGGTFTTDGRIATMSSQTKWFLYGVDLDIPIKKYPILSFRYRVTQGVSRGAWIVVTWEDIAGKTTRSLVWDEGVSREWTEVSLDLYQLLALIAPPTKIKRIELNNYEPPHTTQWDWMKLSSLTP